MRKFVLATLLLQVALVVQCTTRVKRKVDADGYIEDSSFQALCRIWLNNDALELKHVQLIKYSYKLPIPYMYPCENCTYGFANVKYIENESIFYKYDKETDYFETKFTLEFTYYLFECNCHLDPDDERITKEIEAYKKNQLNNQCNKMNSLKKEALEVDPEKVKACFHSRKINSIAKLNVSENRFSFTIRVQEIASKKNNTVAFIVLQTEMESVLFPYVDPPNGNDEKNIIWCLEDTNFFNALSPSQRSYSSAELIPNKSFLSSGPGMINLVITRLI